MDMDAWLERDLVAWGVVERGMVAMADVVLPEVRLARPFRGRIARGVAAGLPVDAALARALAEHPLPPGAVATPRHRAFLAALGGEDARPESGAPLGEWS